MDDLISRQAAIDALKEKEPRKVSDTWTDEYAVGKRMQWEKDVKALNSLPSVQRWIPVTERLPDEGEKVLATHLGGLNPNKQVIEHIYQNGEFTCGWDMDSDVHSPTFGQRFMGKVIAWMPRPEPYKEAE